MKHPLLLAILDGWGLRDEVRDNAVALARKPHYDAWMKKFPHTRLDASAHAVGLPAGVMGNSEVGHLTLGAGRVAYVGLTRIYHAIEDKSFFKNPALLSAFELTKKLGTTLHLIGLVSDGGVHSHQDHLYALLEMASQRGLKKVAVHAVLDGRDTPPQSGLACLKLLQEKIEGHGSACLATATGRFYAMDRDQRWERTRQAYDALVCGKGRKENSIFDALARAYAQGTSDEFIEPLVQTDERGQPRATLRDGDAAIFFNFRADRARQLTRALTQPLFTGFARQFLPGLSVFVCMSEYDATLELPVAFPRVALGQTFGELLAQRGLTQLRIAETEKYAHVTFFFNGGEEKPFAGEERVLIPSPREVATYDLKPEMSAEALADELISRLESDRYDVAVLNFANADMVGHTGNLQAAIRAIETVDAQLGKIQRVLESRGGTLVVTADHGNCEQMKDAQGRPHTAHTLDWVPFLLVDEKYRQAVLRARGTLADVAPTLLQLLGLPKPVEMTGQSLILSV